MKTTFITLVGLVIINAAILLFEKRGLGQGWKIYLGLAGVTLLAAISLPLGLLLLIPITGYNLLVNTARLRRKIGGVENE